MRQDAGPRQRHTLRERIEELQGARTLAIAALVHPNATPTDKARARRLMVDVRRARADLMHQLIMQESRR